MSKELKLEKLEDLLVIDQSTLKADEAKSVIKRVKQLMKVNDIKTEKADEIAEDFPHEGISVVGNQLVTVKFDIRTKEARVVNVEVDTRDTRGKNHMATFKAVERLEKLAKSQKEL